MDSAARRAGRRASYLSSRQPRLPAPLLSFRARVCHPVTRTYVRLLGPCFKTGRLGTFRQHPCHASCWEEPRAGRAAGRASCRRGAPPQFRHSPRELDVVRVFPQSRARHGARRAVTAGTPGVSPRPAHLPATRTPGRAADADQQGADDARRVAAPGNIHARHTAPKRFPFSNFKSF